MREPTFYTHTPLYYQPGTQTDYGIVQRIERVSNTSLYSGGSVPCFAVYCQSAQQCVQRIGLLARVQGLLAQIANR